MIVGVALFELHIPYAQSLKDKRMVVRSLRDRLRRGFDLSAAEVAMQDLHQRARFAISFVRSSEGAAQKTLDEVIEVIENEADATLAGWSSELLPFDQDAPLATARFEFGKE